MKKIIFIRDFLTHGGGGCTMSLWLTNTLLKKFNVQFVFLYEDQVEKNLVNNYTVHYINQFTCPNRYQRLLNLYTKDLIALKRIIKKEAPDFVVSFGTTSQTIATILRFFLPFKLVVSERRDPGSNKTKSDLLRYKCYEFADTVVFQTKGAMHYFNEKIKRKSVIIPNPVKQHETLWKEKPYKLSIINVARMEVVQKRQDLILNAFRRVVNKIPSAELHFCGDGNDLARMKELSKQLGIEESVVFHGLVRDVYSELLKHTIFVLASDYEGMPNALLEAMSIGLPVISTNCRPGGAAELIDNGDNGILVPCNNIDSLSNAMIMLLKDRELRHKISEGAIRKASNYSSLEIEKMWFNIFENENCL